jgi:hypothetical protein
VIPRLDTTVIDLGKDHERISVPDAARQAATVNHVLRAFFGPPAERREVQLLADEVGMGKTYVALAVGYAVLSILRDTARARELEELGDCYRCILVITPSGNPTLASKWDREDEALLTRCARDASKAGWFQSVLCESADQLLQNILRADDRRRRRAPVIMVAQSSVFTKRLSDPAVRFVTACLFRWWAQGLQLRERYRIVLGLAETVGSGAWGDAATWSGRDEYDIQLWDWKRHERFLAASDQEREEWQPRWEWRLFKDISVTYADVQQALDRFDRGGGEQQLEELRRRCREVPMRRPTDRRTRDHAEWRQWFRKLKDEIRDVFKRLWPYLLRKRFPLVITDEAHHWRNNATGDFRSIREFIAPHAKRMLLLTATPFQLNPQETVNVLNVVDHMGAAIGLDRVAELQQRRDRLAEYMESSANAGRDFSREWGSLSDQLARWDPVRFDATTTVPRTEDARQAVIAEIWGQLTGADAVGASAVDQVPGPLRPFFKRALELRSANEDLERAMRPLVVRHRRSTNHRRYWVGREYPPTAAHGHRPDQDRLHLAPGQALEPRDELVQYLLMKVVAAASQGRHRTALGTALTGCYSTMWESQEGRKAVDAAAAGDQPGLLRTLQRLTAKGGRVRDDEHPKLRRVVDAVLQRWDRGEKSLIFCFRVPTALAIHRTLSGRIEDHLGRKRAALIRARGTEVGSDADRVKAMQAFRRSLTARESSGVPLFVDRVLIGWFLRLGWPVPTLTDEDLQAIAALAARTRLKDRVLFPSFERPDRVFLHRAVEHVWSRRLLAAVAGLPAGEADHQLTMSLLRQMADERWVCDRYGRRSLSTGGEKDDDSDVTEKAARSSLAAHYDLGDPEPDRAKQLEEELMARQRSGRETVVGTLIEGPNLLGSHGPALDGLGVHDRDLVALLRDAMFAITHRNDPDGEPDQESWNWAARSTAVDALTRALLRDDILLRMPTSVFEGHDETWAASLFHGFHQPIIASHTGETLAQRVLAFLLELGRMSSKERGDYLAYAMNPKAEAVALVQGSTTPQLRNAIFCGFNTPLLPEILVCTAVGQEGIDLHRECNHVIHYDLGWNPATIEQRTGRADRIGSKTERERRLAAVRQLQLPGLDVALPYLAATYDERMFDSLRTRAQVFEILTGGDPTADRDRDGQWLSEDDEGADEGAAFVPLPQLMLDDLKVELGVTLSPG